MRNSHARRLSTRRITTSAVLAALALIFSYIEVLFPLQTALPGIKLGIANIVVLVALYGLGVRYAFWVNLIRVIIAGLLFNGLTGALYALAGGLLSLTVMWLLKKSNRFSVVGVSMAGGVAHNLGQLLIASLLVSTVKIFFYFPLLLFAGMASGIVIGIISSLILKRLPLSSFL